METNRKNLIINLISIAVILTAIFIYFYSKDKKIIIPKPIEPQKELGITKAQLKYAKKLSPAPIYDYQNLLSLIDKYRSIQKSFYADFNQFINNPKNLKILKKTLKELELERGFFKKYIKKTKQYHARSAPSRKRDSLRYYFRVLEDSIDESKKMIERFRLHIKIQIKNSI
ncbi:MAG: hypothetical protein ABIF12_01165 [bacterium]